MIDLQEPVSPTPGITVAGVTISAIVPHEHGALVRFEQGFDIQLAHKDAPEGFGNARIEKVSGKVTLGDIANAIPAAVAHKYGDAP